jgi:hypothetical protein
MVKVLGVLELLRSRLHPSVTTATIGKFSTMPLLLPDVSDTVRSVELVTLDDVTVEAIASPTTA